MLTQVETDLLNKVEVLESLLKEACGRLDTKALYLERFAPNFRQDNSFNQKPEILELFKDEK